MIARMLGIILVLAFVGIVVAFFTYWLRKRIRKDEIKERKEISK